MSYALSDRSTIPAHVRPDLVVDFDYFAPPGFEQDPLLAWKKVQDECPRVFWTPRNGGHWVATRASEIDELQLDYSAFSNWPSTIPPNQVRSMPTEVDPPEHAALRAVISPLFSSTTLAFVSERAKELAIGLIDDLKPSGRCEYQADFASHLPIAVFLHLVDLPFSDREYLMGLVETRLRDPKPEKQNEAKLSIVAYLADVIERRRNAPGNDFISKIVNSEVAGRRISDDEIRSTLATVLIGGLDTVVASLGFAMLFLARNPDARRWLAQQDSIPFKAIDELLRRHGVVTNSRTLREDYSFRGIEMKKGDPILVGRIAYGLDDERFENPLEVHFDRPNAGQHSTFGGGPHRCVGANLARLEMKLALEEWLSRIPDFRVADDRPLIFGAGIACAPLSLPLEWD